MLCSPSSTSSSFCLNCYVWGVDTRGCSAHFGRMCLAEYQLKACVPCFWPAPEWPRRAFCAARAAAPRVPRGGCGGAKTNRPFLPDKEQPPLWPTLSINLVQRVVSPAAVSTLSIPARLACWRRRRFFPGRRRRRRRRARASSATRPSTLFDRKRPTYEALSIAHWHTAAASICITS